jgi:outer membrane protein assembly factor BamD (BamD/ComL family)
MYDTARYALAREYASLRNLPKAIRILEFYLNDYRDSPLRVSALKLLGYHAGTDSQFDVAVEAYATLLDEYGANLKNAQGYEIPAPSNQRLRHGRSNWDGWRMAPPKDLDAGEIRFYLGHLYWKQGRWAKCAKALEPFVDAPELAKNKSRDKALYMAGQSYYKLRDYAKGVGPIGVLIREYPKFEAIEEAYLNAAMGYVKVRRWEDVDLVYRKFLAAWPAGSDRRPRMDLYAALSLIAQGHADKGVANLKGLAEGDTFEDVKADAAYEAGLYYRALKQPDFATAARYFEKSVATFPRESACLEAARCYMQLRQWTQARQMLNRLAREFPKGDQGVIDEGNALLPLVQKELAKQQGKGDGK